MHPKNYIQINGFHFDWLVDHCNPHSSAARNVIKKKAKKALRRDAKKIIEKEAA